MRFRSIFYLLCLCYVVTYKINLRISLYTSYNWPVFSFHIEKYEKFELKIIIKNCVTMLILFRLLNCLSITNLN